jgi:bacteriorhodopsin
MDLAPADDVTAARQHLLQCPLCASETADDLDEHAINEINGRRVSSNLILRTLLVVSAVQALIALPWIFGIAFLWVGDSEESVAHITRDGVIGFVIGLVGIAVALRPALAYFAISVCAIQVLIQIATIVFDVLDNDVSPTFELLHLLALCILLLVIRVAFPRKR